MSKNASALKVKLSSYDELFGAANAPATSDKNQIVNVALGELHTFQNHPFKVNDDKEMEELAESIREHGVLIPGIVRPRAEGGYELIAGHRRKHGSELAGKTEMPVIIRDYSDDEATIMMVDSNIQRETILPSEKAKAYALKYEALKHQGKRSGKSTLDQVGEVAGENAKKVQRYLWLSRLSDQLLQMVDEKRLGLSQGVDLSFLSKKSQQIVADAIEQSKCTVSMGQSAKLKEYEKQDTLTPAVVRLI